MQPNWNNNDINTFFENYSNDITNDACVLVLENDIDDSNAAPASLPPADITFNKGDPMTVSGWGTTTESGSISPTLKAVTVPHVPDEGKHLFLFISTFFLSVRILKSKYMVSFILITIWLPIRGNRDKRTAAQVDMDSDQ